MPGFGLPSTAPAHLAATGTAFAWMAGIAAACALASAAFSALRIRRPS